MRMEVCRNAVTFEVPHAACPLLRLLYIATLLSHEASGTISLSWLYYACWVKLA